MTLEEAIEKANGGDVGAMESLGSYYMDEHNLGEAFNWFVKAADEGSFSGMVMSANMFNTLAEYDKLHGEWEKAYAKLSQSQFYASKALLSAEDITPILKILGDAMYGRAFIQNYIFKDKHTALETIKMGGDSSVLKHRILQAVCIDLDCEENISEAYKLLSVLKDTKAEELKISEYDSMDQNVFVDGFEILAILLRIYFNQIDLAAEVLIKGYNCITAENGRKTIANELSHYKKGLFGGYKYV